MSVTSVSPFNPKELDYKMLNKYNELEYNNVLQLYVHYIY